MKYRGSPNFNQWPRDKIGVIVTNLRTPMPNKVALKALFKEFCQIPDGRSARLRGG